MVLGAALSALVSAGAQAGLLDTPPPALPGGGVSRIVYRMGPVHYDPGHVDTIVTCTNASDGAVAVAIELFDDDDQRTGGVLVRSSVAPQATVVFATSRVAEFAGAAVFENLAPIEHGKGRVSATTSRLACDGQHLIRSSEPDGVTKTVALELVKKVAFGSD